MPQKPLKLAVAIQKGGCGKTTCSVALAVGWVRQLEARVLLVDCDSQADASLSLTGTVDRDKSLADVLMAEGPYDLAQVITSIEASPGLDLLPASFGLAKVEMVLPQLAGGQLRLRRQLAAVESRYDVILFDCPPSAGHLTFNALGTAQRVLIPILSGEYNVNAVSEMMATVQTVVRNLNPDLKVAGVLLNQVDSTIEARETRRRVAEKWPGLLLTTQIPRSVRVVEAARPGHSVYDHPSKAAAAFESLLLELADHA